MLVNQRKACSKNHDQVLKKIHIIRQNSFLEVLQAVFLFPECLVSTLQRCVLLVGVI